MPQFDESFLSDCALAERWRFYSYNVKQQQQLQLPDEQQLPLPQQQQQQQRSVWSMRDNNNNTSNNNNNNNKHTLHDIKFHRRRKYKKLPRLALSTATTTTPQTTPICTSLTPPCVLVKNVVRLGGYGSFTACHLPRLPSFIMQINSNNSSSSST
ncbi:guanine nucleotide-releasing factor 2-like [Drosophila innubila]|uniref:guanine nucleotide-releasing factor 2-like n=1 Tax=Drosophila innubila TaxID=198719 RepID=UPI00148DF3FA|nr:guanine nucleotide-releasing factor 2-like [Drosophila innubila]